MIATEFTAHDAAKLADTMDRRRNGNCVSIMASTLDKVGAAAGTGLRSCTVEAIGNNVNVDVFMSELALLNYRVRRADADDNLCGISIVIDW